MVHRRLERGVGNHRSYSRVLEIGGHEAEHFPFVKHEFHQYVCSDIKAVSVTPTDSRLCFKVADAEDLPFQDSSFDRVLNVCVLHHIPRAQRALQEIRRVCAPGGLVSIYVPFDPGMLYRYVRHWVSHKKLIRLGGLAMQDAKMLSAREHTNHALGLMLNIKEVFGEDQIRSHRWPFPFFSWNFNLFIVYQIVVNEKK
jgi:ubiquinone/menaquinone biosynthesis C-methylase UbiE